MRATKAGLSVKAVEALRVESTTSISWNTKTLTTSNPLKGNTMLTKLLNYLKRNKTKTPVVEEKTNVYDYLTRNSKIRKMTGVKTFNWGIPAFKAANGFKTCPNAAACAKGCYATQGAYLFSNVAKVFEKRLALALSDSFVSTIDAEIKRRKVERLRIHDSGDFFNAAYLEKWIAIMKANPNVEFYAYSKMVSMLKTYSKSGRIPSNFTIIYSFGGTEDKLIDTTKDRHSAVFTTVRALKRAGYADAHLNDSVALGENHRIGLVYHGTKNYENTDWSKVKGAGSTKKAA